MSGLMELVSNMIPDEAESLREFVEIVTKKGCDTVTILPVMEENKESTRYVLKYSADIPDNRKVVYKQCLFELPAKSLEEESQKSGAAIKLYLLGEKAAQDLRSEFSIRVNLLGGEDNRPMEKDLFDLLHLAAENLGITI